MIDFNIIKKVKDELNITCEKLRKSEALFFNAMLDLEIIIYANMEIYETLSICIDELKFPLLVSKVSLERSFFFGWDESNRNKFTNSNCYIFIDVNQDLKFAIRMSPHLKCPRCWHHCQSVILVMGEPYPCKRCELNINGEGETRKYF